MSEAVGFFHSIPFESIFHPTLVTISARRSNIRFVNYKRPSPLSPCLHVTASGPLRARVRSKRCKNLNIEPGNQDVTAERAEK